MDTKDNVLVEFDGASVRVVWLHPGDTIVGIPGGDGPMVKVRHVQAEAGDDDDDAGVFGTLVMKCVGDWAETVAVVLTPTMASQILPFCRQLAARVSAGVETGDRVSISVAEKTMPSGRRVVLYSASHVKECPICGHLGEHEEGEDGWEMTRSEELAHMAEAYRQDV